MKLEQLLQLQADSMTAAEFTALRAFVADADRQYYDEDNPTITDTDYDKLYFLIQQTEKLHPEWKKSTAVNQISGHVRSDLGKIQHPYPELSLAKANRLETVQQFLDKWSLTTNVTQTPWTTDGFILQHKEDGLTMMLYFNTIADRPFVAATRGNGKVGEDVTASIVNVLGETLINQVLATLKGQKLIVRGEAIINDDDFEALNTDGKYMNSRNLVAGSIRTNDPQIAAQRHVRLLLYNVENNLDLNLQTEIAQLHYLQQLFAIQPDGVVTLSYPLAITDLTETTPTQQAVANGKQILQMIDQFDVAHRDQLNHTIDGLVVKPNNIWNRAAMGYTQHHPRNAIAFKFASPDATTVLREVKWQIGANGVMTPVGIFDPVELLGAKVTKASLASFGNIQRRDLRIGDHILVRRANDVIPQIVKSFAEQRNGNEQPITVPSNAQFDGEILYATKVTNEQQLQQWKRFVSRDGFHIDGLSQQTIKLLLTHQLLDANDFSSLWQLDHDQFITIDGCGEKSWQNLQTQLANAKQVPLQRFFVAMNVPRLGKQLSLQLANEFSTIDGFDLNADLFTASDDALTKLATQFAVHTNGVTRDGVLEILQKLTDDQHTKIAQQLFAVGVQPVLPQMQTTSSSLSGKKIAITGRTNHPRRELTELITAVNGHVVGSVSGNTDLVVTNHPESTTAKITKARTLGIPVITEADLLQQLNQ